MATTPTNLAEGSAYTSLGAGPCFIQVLSGPVVEFIFAGAAPAATDRGVQIPSSVGSNGYDYGGTATVYARTMNGPATVVVVT